MEGRCEDCEKLTEIEDDRCKDCRARFANARQIAFVIDFVITIAAVFAIGAPLFIVVEQVGQPWKTIIRLVWVLAGATLYILFFIRDPFSPGKRAMGLAVIDVHTGHPCTFRQSGKRNLALPLIFIMPFAPLVASRRPRRLGDGWAGTRVVRKRKFQNATEEYTKK